jgi:hypothetical protein
MTPDPFYEISVKDLDFDRLIELADLETAWAEWLARRATDPDERAAARATLRRIKRMKARARELARAELRRRRIQ